jgi:2-polyprenyl-3-methyl-5-hydroxy-6-metoxy-1,4-benzoquinol methylase
MQNQLVNGVPKEQDYKSLIVSGKFKEMEDFSDNFLSANRISLGRYTNKWVRDPLRQWSRQWEYPYVLDKVESFIENTEPTKILDAGSGITFFPYLIKSLYPATDIYCVDNDTNLEKVYQHINVRSKIKVNFSCSDLKELSFPSEWFDVVYCISVLEHTNDYEEIIEGFNRVLRPEGRLVITFDISLDGTRDISVEKAEKLLSLLVKKFDVTEEMPIELTSELSAADIFTTRTAKNIDPTLLPWKLPQLLYRLASLIKGKALDTWPPLLTVFCLSIKKHL